MLQIEALKKEKRSKIAKKVAIFLIRLINIHNSADVWDVLLFIKIHESIYSRKSNH